MMDRHNEQSENQVVYGEWSVESLEDRLEMESVDFPIDSECTSKCTPK